MPDSLSPPPDRQRFVVTLERMLRPLVRLLLDHGVGLPSLVELLKATYVQVADRHFKLQGKAQTDSRISLLTGVHRKDIKRLRDGMNQQKMTFETPLAAQVLGCWTGDERYRDACGQPLPLPRFPREGQSLSFETLVQSAGKDIRPRSLLDEWLHAGIVTLDEHDDVHLQVASAVPSTARDDKLEFMGRNIHDHLAAIGANLRQSPSPFIERCVFYDGLSPDQIALLRALAQERAMDALVEINRLAREMLETRTDSNAADSQRFNFGMYFYHESEHEDER
ncbi:DUF6502 family protein [Paludibacterium yongneupense]|uniref:DUF6502 family protein n=1 Tax=Paludibacterium yongneupense TaxID=400061 RepID=UPI00056D9345|nr:DUF6502 family protein [Paludibacterium yongneupense]